MHDGALGEGEKTVGMKLLDGHADVPDERLLEWRCSDGEVEIVALISTCSVSVPRQGGGPLSCFDSCWPSSILEKTSYLTAFNATFESGDLSSIVGTCCPRISVRWLFLRWEACIRSRVSAIAPVAASY